MISCLTAGRVFLRRYSKLEIIGKARRLEVLVLSRGDSGPAQGNKVSWLGGVPEKPSSELKLVFEERENR